MLNKSAFTVVELLIVITVIGILSALVLNTVQNTSAKARDSQRAHEASLIRKSLEAFQALNGYYPETSSIIGALLELDPDALTDPNNILVNDSGSDYDYQASSCTAGKCQDYILTINLERSPDITYTNP
jgi:prepilin-type N-terminal cleavage/methylation domain-containing protein